MQIAEPKYHERRKHIFEQEKAEFTEESQNDCPCDTRFSAFSITSGSKLHSPQPRMAELDYHEGRRRILNRRKQSLQRNHKTTVHATRVSLLPLLPPVQKPAFARQAQMS